MKSDRLVWFLWLMVINLPRLFNAESIFLEKNRYYLPKYISPKFKVLPRLEFEFPYYDAAVQHVKHYDYW